MDPLGSTFIDFPRPHAPPGHVPEVDRGVEAALTKHAVLHLSHEKSPSCLGYIGDDTTQLNEDYNKQL